MRIAVGIDVAKETHWAAALTDTGEIVLDHAVENDPAAIEALVAELRARGGECTIGLDVLGGIATLLSAMLLAAGQRVVHVPGLAVNRARQAIAGGETKSDPRDARVIADQVRCRRDLRPIAVEDETLAELHLLVGRRRDLVAEQTRRLSRLHDLLSRIHPGLERALDLTSKGGLWLLTRYVTPAEIRAAGRARLLRHLRGSGARHVETIAADALEAAQRQQITLPGERVAAGLCRELAREALAARERLADLDAHLAQVVGAHPDGTLIRSLPGMGVILTAEFLAEVGSRDRFADADALAAAAGLAPVLRQSGKVRFLRRPLGGDKRLKRVFYQGAFCSLSCPASRTFYARKRREGKRHHQALLALARRRVNVLWAMLRDRRPYEFQEPRRGAA
jgi:transposase